MSMGCKRVWITIALWLSVLLLWQTVTTAQDQQSLPDAPTPQQPLPTLPNSDRQAVPEAPAPASTPGEAPEAKADGSAVDQQPREPASQVETVPPGSAPPPREGAREQLFTLVKLVNFVLVPVTVKDDSGHLVEGLLNKDFSIYEDGVPQQVKFFTSDPFPLSVAVVIDVALPQVELDKVQNTLPALTGAFSQFDELAIYTYGSTVKKVQDFTAVTDALTPTLKRLKNVRGRSGAPVVGGPLGQSGPTVNGRPVEPQTPAAQIAPRESAVLNDALLEAALELGGRDPTRRKILFVISDGREIGSSSTYSDVTNVLLSRQIAVFAVTVGGGAIPGYRQLQKLRVPGLGYGDVLPKYASATGGQVFPELTEQAIETAYARVTGEARNQYTIGYTTRATPSSAYRSIEVRVHRPGLRVYAKDGYFPLPVGR